MHPFCQCIQDDLTFRFCKCFDLFNYQYRSYIFLLKVTIQLLIRVLLHLPIGLLRVNIQIRLNFLDYLQLRGLNRGVDEKRFKQNFIGCEFILNFVYAPANTSFAAIPGISVQETNQWVQILHVVQQGLIEFLIVFFSILTMFRSSSLYEESNRFSFGSVKFPNPVCWVPMWLSISIWSGNLKIWQEL